MSGAILVQAGLAGQGRGISRCQGRSKRQQAVCSTAGAVAAPFGDAGGQDMLLEVATHPLLSYNLQNAERCNNVRRFALQLRVMYMAACRCWSSSRVSEQAEGCLGVSEGLHILHNHLPLGPAAVCDHAAVGPIRGSLRQAQAAGPAFREQHLGQDLHHSLLWCGGEDAERQQGRTLLWHDLCLFCLTVTRLTRLQFLSPFTGLSKNRLTDKSLCNRSWAKRICRQQIHQRCMSPIIRAFW